MLAAACQQRQSEQDLEEYVLALEDVPTRADLRAAEPLQWKGGRLVAIWKGKQNPLFLSPLASLSALQLGKLRTALSGTAVYRLCSLLHLPFKLEASLGTQLCSPHTWFACSNRVAVERPSTMSWFLDLRQAFYRVVRGLLLCADLTHAGVAPILAQVKLSPEVAHDLQRHLSGEPLVSGAGATDWAAYGMCEILSETWFRFQGSEQVIQTQIGSRPGDNCADIAFGFIFAHILRRVHEAILPTGYLPSLPWHPDVQGCVFPFHQVPACSLSPLDSTWMDDAALMVQAEGAGDLANAVVRVTSSLVEECLGRALLPNLDEGPSRKVTRLPLFTSSSPELPLECAAWPSARLRLVTGYVHQEARFTSLERLPRNSATGSPLLGLPSPPKSGESLPPSLLHRGTNFSPR